MTTHDHSNDTIRRILKGTQFDHDEQDASDASGATLGADGSAHAPRPLRASQGLSGPKACLCRACPLRNQCTNGLIGFVQEIDMGPLEIFEVESEPFEVEELAFEPFNLSSDTDPPTEGA